MKLLTDCLLDFDGANERNRNEIVLVKKDWPPSLKAKTICEISFSCLSECPDYKAEPDDTTEIITSVTEQMRQTA